MNKKTNPHEKHRIRTRERFKKEGLEGFTYHEILELLLYYAIPQKDTNEIAHNLIDKFGSLSAVFDADINMLQTVCGIGEYSATLIKLIPNIARAYLMDKNTRYPNFSDIHKLGTYLCNYFVGATKEKFIAIYLTNSLDMIDIVVISDGTVNKVCISARKIAEGALNRNASFVVVAHNHPDGNSLPSDNDIIMTNELKSTLNGLDISLLEHLVVGGNSYTGIITKESSGAKYIDFNS